MNKSKTKTVWVLTGESESSDHYGPVVFCSKPSQDRIRDLCFEWDGDQSNPDGPGDFGSFVYTTLTRVKLEE